VIKPAQRLAWVQDGTARLQAELDGLSDEDFKAPSLLPGWSRRHLIAHIAANADALSRLAYWARTGEERRMYSSFQQRNAEIEVGAGRPATELRNWVSDSVAQLTEDLERLTEEAWQATVINAQGQGVLATQIPWLRAREVYVHAVDLKTGTTFADSPEGFLKALIDDVADRRSSLGTGPALALTATDSGAADSGAAWNVAGTGEVYVIAAPLPVLAGWLTGRSTAGLPVGAPDLLPWL
jgi:maleylpyruvate isomerase